MITDDISQHFATLTPAEMAVMLQLSRVDPESAKRLPHQVAKDAGIDRVTYWRIRNKPEFRALLAQQVQDMLQVAALPILHARIQCATTPNRDGHNDAKMLLAAAGIIEQEAQRGDVQLHVTISEIPWQRRMSAVTEVAVVGEPDNSRDVALCAPSGDAVGVDAQEGESVSPPLVQRRDAWRIMPPGCAAAAIGQPAP